MPKLKQPEKLEKLSMTALGVWICDVGETIMPKITKMSKVEPEGATDILSVTINNLRELMQYNVPRCLYDKLRDELFVAIPKLINKTKSGLEIHASMAKILNHINVGVSLTEILISSNLTSLNFDVIPKIMRHIFYVKLSYLQGLRFLNLGSMSGGWKTTDMESTVLRGIVNMKHLRSLSINYDCTENILISLVENCPNLQSLDISNSKLISDDSVDIIINLKNLKYLQMYKTSVNLEGYVKTLLNLDKLEDLGRCDELGRVFEYIKQNYTNRTFNLRKYVTRYASSLHLQLLAEFCPEIDSISVFHNALISDLMILISLDKLNDIKLLSCDFFADQIKQVLQVKGCNISFLHLEHVDEIDLNALMYISQFCPDLKKLTLYNCELLAHTSLFTKKLDLPPFINLEKLIIASQCLPHHLEFILSNCLRIKFIHLGTAVPTTDELFERILSKNPMMHLEEMRIIFSEELTISTAYKLVEICPNLCVLSELESWVKVTSVDLNVFKNFLSFNNIDLDISPLRRFEA